MEGTDPDRLAALAWCGDGSNRNRTISGRPADLVVGTQSRFRAGRFFVLTVALTQPMSNQAAAIVVLPIAFETAGNSASTREALP